MSANCIELSELPDFDEVTGVLPKDDDSDEEVEIELKEEDPPFLRGHGRQSMELSPVRIVKVGITLLNNIFHSSIINKSSCNIKFLPKRQCLYQIWRVRSSVCVWGCFHSQPRNLKGEIGSLFEPCVNAVRRRPYWQLCMEVSYRTFRFSAIFRRNQSNYHYRVIHCAISYMRAWLKSMREMQLTLNEIAWQA